MAHLLIVELPGGNDTDILDAAAALGHDVTFLTSRIDLYRGRPAVDAALRRCAAVIALASFDAAEAARRVLARHAACPIDAVLCLIETRLPEAARLARELGTRHLSPETAARLRDKHAVRRRLAAAGLPQPAYAGAASNAALRHAVEGLGLPVVIKPSDGYGSQHIVALRDADDLDPVLSPLDDLLPLRADYGLGVRGNERLLVERLMSGTLVACDVLSADGRHHLLGVNEKTLCASPSFAIAGGCWAVDHPQRDALQAYAFAALDAVGFDWGAAHVEIMLTADGPRLVEINPRLVGARLPRQINLALGRPVHADLIRLHLGEGLPAADAGRTPPRFAVTRWLVAEQSGVLQGIDLPLHADPRIARVEMLRRNGEWVCPPFENADRLGYVMTCSAVRADAEAAADAFIRGCRVRLGARVPEPLAA